MKVSIVGLLRMASRHLALLDELVKGDIDIADLEDRMDANQAELILQELIEHIQIVQADPSKIDDFLRIYCIKKS